MRRRDKVLAVFSLSAFVGAALLVGFAAWIVWNKFLETEEQAVAELARTVGERAEYILVDTRNTLKDLNELSLEPCSGAHLTELDRIAFAAPHILSIGYWQAAERQCGAGFTHAIQLSPTKADRIYDSGIIAWWPGPQTEVEGVQLFLMRYGRYDVAIDPRALLRATPTRQRRVALWVEGLRMAAVPWTAELPSPQSIASGLSVDRREGRLLARFSLDTVLPIDVVVTEPIGRFWDRYWPTVMAAGGLVLALAGLWIYSVLFYMRRRLSLAVELREALAAGEIKAKYQPIIDLATGKCVGAEALARWTRDDGNSVNPETFIAVAEETDLMPRITREMLEITLHDLGLFLHKHPEARIHINLSPQDLEDEAFAEALTHRVWQENLPARCIKLEITERALINSDTGHRIIDHLRGKGHEVSIDDFGTGYSSLSYLQSFNLDALKIDKSFVNAIGTEAVTSQVIYHIIELAKGLDLNIVAEGVETKEQADWLRSQGVAYAQGFLFGEPVWARDFQHFFRQKQEANLYFFTGTNAQDENVS